METPSRYTAGIEDLGAGDFVKIDCAAREHTALLTPAFLTRVKLEPRHKMLDLKDRARCRGCGARAGPSCRSNERSRQHELRAALEARIESGDLP